MESDFEIEFKAGVSNCPYCGDKKRVKPDRVKDCGEWFVLVRCFECMTGGPFSPFYRTIPNPWRQAVEKWNAMVKGTGPVKRKRKARGAK